MKLVESGELLEEVSFSAYEANELRLLLEQRQEVAFHDDVLEDGVIGMCAAFGAKDSGDARKALDLLLRAGDIARENDAESVTEEHVRQARNRLQRDQVVEGIRNYSEHSQLVLYALLQLEKRRETPARTSEILDMYQSIATRKALSSVPERSVRDYLTELNQLGIISSEEYNQSKGGGKYKKHELVQSVSSVENGLSILLDSE